MEITFAVKTFLLYNQIYLAVGEKLDEHDLEHLTYV